MWSAVRRRKPDRVLARHGQDVVAAWRHVVAESEDLLTSAVFERLGYLPNDLGMHLLLQAAEVGRLRWIPLPAEVSDSEPWPNLAEAGMLEPDWIWHAGRLVVIVEAKWGRGVVPTKEQIRDQHVAARERWPRRRILHVVVVQTGTVAWPDDCDGVVVRWRAIRESVQEELRKEQSSAVERILADLLGVLEARGLGTRFFDSILRQEVRGLFGPLFPAETDEGREGFSPLLPMVVDSGALLGDLQ